jgi:hypothetical protein
MKVTCSALRPIVILIKIQQLQIKQGIINKIKLICTWVKGTSVNSAVRGGYKEMVQYLFDEKKACVDSVFDNILSTGNTKMSGFFVKEKVMDLKKVQKIMGKTEQDTHDFLKIIEDHQT